eukprot:365509-Chlamydomonas_euryale.AAC.14
MVREESEPSGSPAERAARSAQDAAGRLNEAPTPELWYYELYRYGGPPSLTNEGPCVRQRPSRRPRAANTKDMHAQAGKHIQGILHRVTIRHAAMCGHMKACRQTPARHRSACSSTCRLFDWSPATRTCQISVQYVHWLWVAAAMSI